MSRFLQFLMLCVVCLGMIPVASASWEAFVSTGTATGIGNPSCALVTTGHVVCAVRTGKAAIMVDELNGTAWNGWKTLSMTVISDPSCASDGGGKVICAATATTGNLQVSIFDGTTERTGYGHRVSVFGTELRSIHPRRGAVCRSQLEWGNRMVPVQRRHLERVREPYDVCGLGPELHER